MRGFRRRDVKRLARTAAAICVSLFDLGLSPLVAKSTGITCQQEAILLSTIQIDIHKNWKMKKNEVCAGKIELPLLRNDSIWAPDGFLNNFVIVKRATHGIVGVTNSDAYGGFAYQPNDNFTGSDAFEINVDRHRRAGADADEAQKVHITVDVEVTN